MRSRLALLISLAFAATTPATAADVAGRASVIDGDTIEIREVRIRLFGIDAPEGRQLCQDDAGKDWRCGQQSALALSDKLGQATVSCQERDRDRYGRTVAVCHLDGEDIGSWLVQSGWAVAYRKYSLDYVPDEDQARQQRAGIWAGSVQMPWDWRAAERAPVAPQTAPDGCVIKGNISSNSGKRIYHVPGQQDYEATRISPDKGERWFCTEEEAVAAGWRKAGRWSRKPVSTDRPKSWSDNMATTPWRLPGPAPIRSGILTMTKALRCGCGSPGRSKICSRSSRHRPTKPIDVSYAAESGREKRGLLRSANSQEATF